MSQQHPDKLRDIAQAVRETIDSGQRLREVEDALRIHLATLSSLLLGFSLFGFQAKNREGDWYLLLAMVGFVAAIAIATWHAHQIPGWLRYKLTSPEDTKQHMKRTIRGKRGYNIATSIAGGFGLTMLLLFTGSNLDLF